VKGSIHSALCNLARSGPRETLKWVACIAKLGVLISSCLTVLTFVKWITYWSAMRTGVLE
jgi:hypothetical protein